MSLIDNTIIVEGTGLCGRVNEPAKFYYSFRYLVSAIFIIIGCTLMFYGGYKWELLAGSFGFVSGFLFIFGVYWVFLSYNAATSSYALVSILAFISGGLLAKKCSSWPIISYLLLGFATGFFLMNYFLIALDYSGEDVI